MADINPDKVKPDKVLTSLGNWEEPSIDDIITSLGRGAVEPFSYAFSILGRRKRKECDHLSIAHSYRVALRTRNFLEKRGYSIEDIQYIINMSLLHDIPEDSCSTLESLAQKRSELKRKYSQKTADDILLMTNRYTLLMNELFGDSLSGIETAKSVDLGGMVAKVIANMDRLTDITASVSGDNTSFVSTDNLMNTSSCVLNYLYDKATDNISRDDIKEIKLKLYDFYLQDIFRESYSRFKAGDEKFYVPILVKLIDGIDNVRTMPVSKAYEAELVIRKTEMKIDLFSDFIKKISSEGCNDTLLPDAVYETKKQLISMTLTKLISNMILTDTSYDLSEKFYEKSLRRLVEKYDSEMEIYLEGFFTNEKPILQARYPLVRGAVFDGLFYGVTEQVFGMNIQARDDRKHK